MRRNDGRRAMAMFTNFLAFQAGWFAAVISASLGEPWLGTLIMAGVIALHLAGVERRAPELMLIVVCGAIGGAWDSMLVAAGWVAYPAGMVLPWLAPYWIVVMWMQFATTLNLSLGWLRQRPALAMAFGAAGGPLAYYAGSKLGGIWLLDPNSALAALAVGWGVMMPLLLLIASRFDGVTVEADARQGWILD